MVGLIENIVNKYNYVIHELADPRTQEWWGVSNPLVVLSIVTAYLYFCKSLGPRLMENRKPFELKTILMVYNFFQVCFSMYLFYEGYVYVFSKEYSFACERVDYSQDPRALRIASGAWFYYIAKLTELLDTVFFVLRKKYKQVSFLHVYHHTLMSLVIWIGVKYIPGGHTIFMGFLNSLVHIIMYTYYLISGFGPEYQKYLWWKKHVTLIQLVQFVIVFIHNASVFFYECEFPKIVNFLCCLNASLFIKMFGQFYIKNYNRKPKSKTSLETKKRSSLTNKVNNDDAVDARRKIVEKYR